MLGPINGCRNLLHVRIQDGGLYTSMGGVQGENGHKKVPNLWLLSPGSDIWGTGISIEYFILLTLTNFYYYFNDPHVKCNLRKCWEDTGLWDGAWGAVATHLPDCILSWPCPGEAHPRCESLLLAQGGAIITNRPTPDDPAPLVPAPVHLHYWWVYPRSLLVWFFRLFVHTVTNIFAYLLYVCLICKPVNPPPLSPAQLRVSELKFSTQDFRFWPC